MKQRILSAALALCLFFSSQSAAHAWQEDLSPQEDILTEESVSVLTARDSTIPTLTEVYEAMIALKDQDAYKEGTAWTDYEPYSDSKGYYYWNGGTLGGTNIVAVGCVAFAFILSDAAFGNLPARMYAEGGFTFEDIKAGDILRVNNDTHTVIVLEVNEAGVIVAEGNNNGLVHWERAISKDDVMNSASHYITRYPEGYISPDDPAANEIIKEGTLDGGLTWNLTKAGTMTISGSGAIPDFSSASEQPWNSYSGQIRKVIIENGVTSIGSCAFWNCGVLSAEIPSSVTAIGNNAFRGSSILSVTIPSSVTTIGDSAFRECQNLSSITFSEGLETIEQNAFRACTNLKSIALPASIGSVGAAAFYECTSMTSAAFAPGSKQVKMGANMFTSCWYLMSVTLPQSIDCISEGMFQSCILLPGVIIPQGTASIEANAFTNCSRFEAVLIPDSVTAIETAAFTDSSLTDIYYTGTQSQWNSISKATDTSSPLLTATIHYEYSPDSTPEPAATPTPDTTAEPDSTPAPDTTAEPDSTPAPDTTAEPKPTAAPKPTTAPAQTPAPDTDVPFINGGSGKEGWESINEEAANSSEGNQIHVNMNGASTVPGYVLDSVKDQDVTIYFDMGGGIVWSVNGKNVTSDHVNDVNLSIQVETSAIPQNIVNNVAGDRQTTQLSLAHSGDFGYSAVLMIDMDSANAGLYANLFYYNESTDKLEFVTVGRINENGIAELVFTHASDYVIVVGNDVMDGSSSKDSSEDDGESASVNDSSSQGTGEHSPKTGEFDIIIGGNGLNLMWLLLIGAVGMAAMGAITFLIQKKVNK